MHTYIHSYIWFIHSYIWFIHSFIHIYLYHFISIFMYNSYIIYIYIYNSGWHGLLHGDIGGLDLTQPQEREGTAWVSAALPLRQTKIRSCTCRKSLGKTNHCDASFKRRHCDKMWQAASSLDCVRIWYVSDMWHCWVLMLLRALKPKTPHDCALLYIRCFLVIDSPADALEHSTSTMSIVVVSNNSCQMMPTIPRDNSYCTL